VSVEVVERVQRVVVVLVLLYGVGGEMVGRR
jgi:hypothetical protein